MSLELSLEDVKKIAAHFGLVLKVCILRHYWHLHASTALWEVPGGNLILRFGDTIRKKRFLVVSG